MRNYIGLNNACCVFLLSGLSTRQNNGTTLENPLSKINACQVRGPDIKKK